MQKSSFYVNWTHLSPTNGKIGMFSLTYCGTLLAFLLKIPAIKRLSGSFSMAFCFLLRKKSTGRGLMRASTQRLIKEKSAPTHVTVDNATHKKLASHTVIKAQHSIPVSISAIRSN